MTVFSNPISVVPCGYALFRLGLVFSFGLVAGAASVAGVGPSGGALHLEAEVGQLSGGTAVASDGAGFSGTGYVTGFVQNADRVTLAFNAKAGIYDLVVRYRSPIKGFLYEVNGLTYSGKFADSKGEFREQRFGKVELREGTNTIALHGGWHRYEIDRLDLAPVAELPALAKPPATLCNPDSIPAARALMAYLVDQYGEHTLSGAIADEDLDYVKETTGRQPAIVASDLLNISTSAIRHMGVAAGDTERMIERAREGHILSFCWHWRSPTGLVDKMTVRPDGTTQDSRWYMGFYTHASTFDLEAALANPQGPDYTLLIADIDMVAGELGKLADWGIPVLWRPLHESEGGWFWWGAKGPKPFIQLWRILNNRLTRLHGLNNLIWVYTGTGNPEWYPGDDVVDIVGIDEYPADVRDPLSAIWDDAQATFGGRKLVALSEFGGVPDLAAARRLGVNWAYFASWSRELGPRKMDPAVLRRIYNDPRVINFSELPKDRWAPLSAPRKR